MVVMMAKTASREGIHIEGRIFVKTKLLSPLVEALKIDAVFAYLGISPIT